MDSTAPTNLQYRPFGVVLRDLLIDCPFATFAVEERPRHVSRYRLADRS